MSPATTRGVSVGIAYTANHCALLETIHSIKPCVTEVIVAAGRLDHLSRSICERHGCRLVETEAQDDFGQARNQILAAAEGSWILWLEAGDRLSHDDCLRVRDLGAVPPDQGPCGYFLEVRYSEDAPNGSVDVQVVDEIRIHRRHEKFRCTHRSWQALSYELLRCDANVVWTDIVLNHSLDPANSPPAMLSSSNVAAVEKDAGATNGEPYWQFLWGRELLRAEKFSDAAAVLDAATGRANERDRQVADAWAALAECQVHMGEFGLARNAIIMGKQHAPDDPVLLFHEGVVHQQLGHLQRAIACYKTSKRSRRRRGYVPFDITIPQFRADHNIALAHFQLGEADQAEQLWQSVTDKFPLCRQAQIALGELYLSRSSYDVAMRHAHEMAKYRAFLGDSLVLLAQVAAAQGKIGRARRYLETAVRYAPENVRAIQELCQHYRTHGPQDEVEPILEQLVRRDPTNHVTHFNRGAWYHSMMQWQSAIEAYHRCLEIQPSFAQAHANLGHAYQSIGQPQRAQQAWDRAKSCSKGRDSVPSETIDDPSVKLLI